MNVREMAEDLSTALYSLGCYKFADQEVPGFRPAGHAGTFGAICRSPNGLFGLSNNHVFAECNHAPIDHPILSPSANDTGANLPYPRALFKHTRFAPLHSGDPFQMAPTKIDAAIAEVLDESSVSSNQGTYYDTPIAGLKVKKVVEQPA